MPLARALKAAIGAFAKDRKTADDRLAGYKQKLAEVMAPEWEAQKRAAFETQNGELRRSRPSNYFDLTLPRTTPQILFVRDFGRCVKVAGDTLVSAPISRWDAPPQGCVQHAQMWREVDWTKIAELVTP